MAVSTFLLQKLAEGGSPIVTPDPVARYKTLAAAKTTLQEQQINALNIQSGQTKNDEWAQVKAIFNKHHGDPEGAISEVLQTPWRSKEITDIYQNESDRMRKQAVENLALQQGQETPPSPVGAPGTKITPPAAMPPERTVAGVTVPAPQAENAPIAAGYMGSEQLPEVSIPFSGGVKVRPKSAHQQIIEHFRTKKMESDIARDAKIAEAQATREANVYTITDPTSGKTITAPKDIIDNILTQTGQNFRHATPAAVAPQAGRDVPLPAEVEEQRKRITAAGKAAPTAAPGQTADDPKEIAAAIIRGEQPPNLQGLYRVGAPVRAELARKGFDLATAQRDWTAIQRHLSTLNGAQQERLRQAVTFTYDSLDNIEQLYNEWKANSAIGVSRFKIFNKANLRGSKELGSEAGSIAQNLEAQINDLTSELGTVYKGGNASTDETLRLAAENLKAEWNEQTFTRALGQIRKNLNIRKNSILTSQPVGVSPNSPYNPQADRGQPAASGTVTIITPDGAEHPGILRENADAALRKYPGSRVKQ